MKNKIKKVINYLVPEKYQKIIIPLIIEQFLLQSSIFIDIFMATFLGSIALSSVSFASQIDKVLLGFFSAFSIASGVTIAMSFGKGDIQKVKNNIFNNLFLVIILSAFVMITLIIFKNELLLLVFGAVSNELFENMKTYYIVCLYSLPFVALSFSLSTILKISKHTKFTINLSILTNILNLIFNAISIFVFDYGVMGIAISTLLVRIIQCAILVMFFSMRYKKYFNLYLLKYSNNKIIYEFKNMFSVGCVSGIERGLFDLIVLMIRSVVSTLGIVVMSANSIATRFGGLCIFGGLGVQDSVVPILGYTVGQDSKNLKNIKECVSDLMLMGYKMVAFSNVISIIFMVLIIPCLKLEPEVKALVILCQLVYVSFNIILYPSTFILQKVLIVFKENKYILWISTFSTFIFRFLVFLMTARYIGIFGMYLGMILDWGFRSLMFSLKYKEIKKRY